MNIKFKCPKCGTDRLECCLNGPHTAPVTNIDGEGDFEYGDYESSSDVDRFQCLECGYVLEQRGGSGFGTYTITEHNEVVEWCKKHCKQGDN